MKKTIIVACSLNNVIGRDGNLPWANNEKYTGDLRRFKELTLNNTVIMGRKTFESLNCNPLKSRRNIVVSKSRPFENINSVEVYSSISDALAQCSNKSENVYFVGGSTLYKFALPYTDEIDMTIIPEVCYSHSRAEKTVYFPTLDNSWKLLEEFEHPYNSFLKVKKFIKTTQNL